MDAEQHQPQAAPLQCDAVMRRHRLARNDVPRASGSVRDIAVYHLAGDTGDIGPPVGVTFRFVGTFVGAFGTKMVFFPVRCDS